VRQQNAFSHFHFFPFSLFNLFHFCPGTHKTIAECVEQITDGSLKTNRASGTHKMWRSETSKRAKVFSRSDYITFSLLTFSTFSLFHFFTFSLFHFFTFSLFHVSTILFGTHKNH